MKGWKAHLATLRRAEAVEMVAQAATRAETPEKVTPKYASKSIALFEHRKAEEKSV